MVANFSQLCFSDVKGLEDLERTKQEEDELSSPSARSLRMTNPRKLDLVNVTIFYNIPLKPHNAPFLAEFAHNLPA